MAELRLEASAPVGGDAAPLVGLTDLMVIAGPSGPVLISAARGGGWLSAYDVSGGAARLLDRWEIGEAYLQLESTDVVPLPDGGLWLAGLASAGMVRVDWHGTGFGPVRDLAVSGLDMRVVSTVSMVSQGAGMAGFAGRRDGGLTVLRMDAQGQVTDVVPVTTGDPMHQARVTAVETVQTANGTYGFAAFGWKDMISAVRLEAGGDVTHAGDVTTTSRSPGIAQPGALGAVKVDGVPYLVAAASGSGSLSVFSVEPGGALIMTDHVLDNRDTRFSDAAHLEVIEVGGRSYAIAAGRDSGLSLFEILPGGRLHHLESVAATIGVPLGGITDIAVSPASDGGLRIWVATQQAPHLVEFNVMGLPAGVVRAADDNGLALDGTAGSDVLAGGSGNDSLSGGAGRDVLMDGAGEDTLRGGAGADVFILSGDGESDRVMDFEPGLDRLDLTGLAPVRDFDDVIVSATPWGARISFLEEEIIVRKPGGGALDRADFVEGGLVTTDRLKVVLDVTGGPDGTDGTGSDGSGEQDSGNDPGGNPASGDSPDDGGTSDGGGDPGAGDGGGDSDPGGNPASGDGPDDGSMPGGGGNPDDGDGQDAGPAGISGNGSPGADSMTGGAGNDTLSGLAGADTLRGLGGDDSLVGGAGADLLDADWQPPVAVDFAGAAEAVAAMIGRGDLVGADDVAGSAFDDALIGDGQANILRGRAGDDVLNGLSGDDTLEGGAGADTLLGSRGADTLDGGTGRDMASFFNATGPLFVDVRAGMASGEGHAAGDTLISIEDVFGSRFADTLRGNAGENAISGYLGDDLIRAGGGDDTLHGGGGDDSLFGGRGDDFLIGGDGADRFIFEDTNFGQDRIGDWEDGVDKLDFIDAGLDQDDFAILQVAGDTVLRLNSDPGQAVMLTGVAASSIWADDFL